MNYIVLAFTFLLYCSETLGLDFEVMFPGSQNDSSIVIQKIKNLALSGNLKAIHFSSFTFKNSDVRALICPNLLERGVEVNFFLNRQGDQAELNKLLACTQKKNAGKFNLHLLGQINDFSLHHQKFIYFEGKLRRDDQIIVSSGNLSRGLTEHEENWSLIKYSQQMDVFFANHRCLISVLKANARSRADYTEKLNLCRVSEVSSPVKSYFLPSDSYNVMNYIDSKFKLASEIDIASHHFSLLELYKLVESSPFKKIRILVDSAHQRNLNGFKAELTPKSQAWLLNMLNKLPHVEVRGSFIGSTKLMHHKFIHFRNGPLQSLFWGSGNFTRSSLLSSYDWKKTKNIYSFTTIRSNTENFYSTEKQEIIEKYQSRFEMLWSLSKPIKI